MTKSNKICLWSDLHLEFQDKAPLWKNPGADVLILSGDTFVAEHLWRNPTAGLDNLIQKGFYANNAILYREFLAHVSKEFKTVLMIMGNHEHYSGRWDRTEDVIREELKRFDNVFLLEQDRMVINDVVYLGATLWTDMNKGNPIVLQNIRTIMNDYQEITQKTGDHFHKLNPTTTVAKHNETVVWLKRELAADSRPTVVIGHHMPSYKSIHPKYASQTVSNYAYASDLSDVILDNPHVKLWTCGHTHHAHSYYIGETLVECNPHGYPGETTDFDAHKVIDIDSL